MARRQPTIVNENKLPKRNRAVGVASGQAGGLSRWLGGKATILSLSTLIMGCALGFVLSGPTARLIGDSPSTATQAAKDVVGSTSSQVFTLADLLVMDDAALGRLDPLDVDLAVARTIPGCESLGVALYKRTVDQWAEQVRSETERHLYKFHEKPSDYKNSLVYFKSLLLATVIGQDLKVTYEVKSVAFEDPRDLFVHGVIDQRRGTCVSLPVLYMAIGYRLGYPIRAVTVAKHIFCRWDDPQTGERLNIEAASAGGLVDHPDDYYMSWPTKCDPKDVETGGVLKSLTMREFLALKLASSGDYYWHKNQRPEAEVAYALAHSLFPANRYLYEILTSQVLDESDRYPWSETHGLLKKLTTLRPAYARVPATQKGSS